MCGTDDAGSAIHFSVEHIKVSMNITLLQKKTGTYDHRVWRTGLPVRSAVLKPHAGRLVVGWVTTSESLLLYVFIFRSAVREREPTYLYLDNGRATLPVREGEVACMLITPLKYQLSR